MKNKLKILPFMLLFSMLALAACQDRSQAENVTETTSAAETSEPSIYQEQTETTDETILGRYIEEDVSLPEEVQKVYSVQVLEDLSLLLVCRTETAALQCYTSQNRSDSWEIYTIDTSDAVPENHAVIDAVASRDGTVFFCYAMIESENPWGTQTSLSYSHRMIDNSGTITDINLASTPGTFSTWAQNANRVSISSDNSVLFLAQTEGGATYGFLVDSRTGLAESSYEIKSGALNVTEHILLVRDSNGLMMYDSCTGEEKDYLILPNELANSESLFSSSEGSDTFIVASGSGIYSCINNANVIEQLIDGSSTTLYHNNYSAMELYNIGEQEYIISYQNHYQTPLLKRYRYSSDTPAAAQNQLTVYSLIGISEVQNMVLEFQKQNPDYSITYEIGMSNGNYGTITEAIKALNTEIMAGNGPDVLILNDLPIDAYIEQGVLAELDSVMRSHSEKDSLFENITRMYETDETTYAVPVSFKVPVLYADEEGRSTITSLEHLSLYLTEKTSSFNGEFLIADVMTAETLLLRLSCLYSEELLNDNTIDKEMVKSFMINAKTIYSKMKEYWTSDYNSFNFEDEGNQDIYYEELGLNTIMFSLIHGESFMALGYLSNFEDLADLEYGKTRLAGYDYQPVSSDINYFMPGITVGLSSKANDLEGGRLFINFMMDENAQSTLLYPLSPGFPVNKAVFRQGMEEPDTNTLEKMGVNLEGYTWASQEAFDNFENMVEALDTSVLMNRTLFETLYEQTMSYFNEENNLDSAAANFAQKIKLYLNE